MAILDPAAYPPAVAELLRRLPLAPLGPGQPDRSVRDHLQALTAASLVTTKAVDAGMVTACRAGLWLAFDYLDESHTISQGLHTAEGSFWHAIMHRREPDAWNSKYWWNRVGAHPVLAQLRQQAPALGYAFTTPDDFVDVCERVRGSGSAEEMTARQVQRLEWELLFAWCWEHA